MKQKRTAQAILAAAALLCMYGCVQGISKGDPGTGEVKTAAADQAELKEGEIQESEEVIDYTGMDNPTAETEEGRAVPYMAETFSEEDWIEEHEKDFYERHKDMDFNEDGEITGYESSRWDFIHADLEAEIADLKPLGQQGLYLDRYLLAYLEMDMDEFEDLSLMEQADQMDAAYAQMCSDRNMTMDELEAIFEIELRANVDAIRKSDPHYWGDTILDMEEWDPREQKEFPDDPEKIIDLDTID